MKISKYLMTFAAAAWAFAGCEVEPTDLFSTDPVAPVLDAHADILLTEETMQEIVTFSWSAARNIGSNVTYIVEASIDGSDAMPAELAETELLSVSLTKQELYDFLTTNFDLPEHGAVTLNLTVTAVDDEAQTSETSTMSSVVVNLFGDAEPEPEVPAATWSLIGVNGDWNTDYFLSPVDKGLWVSEVITFSGDFKLRFNGAWDVNRGGTMSAIGQPFSVENNGDNIDVSDEGSYYVVYDEVNETVTVNDASQGWGLIGDALANGWGSDTYKLLEVEEGIFRSGAVKIGTGGFKLRKDPEWKENFGSESDDFRPTYGESFTAKSDGSNITLEDSDVTVYITLDTKQNTITIDNAKTRFKNRWGVVGVVSGMNWDGDVFMYKTDDNKWRSVPFHIEGEFKIRKDADWADDRTGTFEAFGTAFSVAQGPDNIIVGDENLDKNCYLIYDPSAETIVIDEVK